MLHVGFNYRNSGKRKLPQDGLSWKAKEFQNSTTVMSHSFVSAVTRVTLI